MDTAPAAMHAAVTRWPAEPLRLDRLIRAGAIHSMTGQVYRCVGLYGDRIAAVSADPHGLDDLAGGHTVTVDAADLTLLPAFSDSHEHLMEASRNTLLVPVDQAHNVAEFTAMVAAAARDAAPGAWIVTSMGWHESNLAENRLPTGAELDAAAPGHPVLARRGGHLAIASTAALDAAGVGSGTPDPTGGSFGRMPDGRLSGLLEGGKEVAAHCACWAEGTPLQEGKRAATTLERWQQVHELRAPNVGLLECARRLNLSLNTVKRYDRASEPERLQRVPKYRPTLVDPYRDHLRKRRAEEPAVPVQQLLREIRERGYQGSSNLLVRYINQGRLDSDRPHLSPRRAARLLLTRPDRLTGGQAETLARIEAACSEMTALAALIRSFAEMLTPAQENEARLQRWITTARQADLPHVHSFTRGLDLDIQAATAALTMPHHNGRTEGVNTKTKMIKRQMYGRAGFTLLRHRILLG
jgi:hypothetical protein